MTHKRLLPMTGHARCRGSQLVAHVVADVADQIGGYFTTQQRLEIMAQVHDAIATYAGVLVRGQIMAACRQCVRRSNARAAR